MRVITKAETACVIINTVKEKKASLQFLYWIEKSNGCINKTSSVY
jgi:hypothetical protein